MGYYLNRKSWLTDKSNPMGLKNECSLNDLFDNSIKHQYRITDDEYDLICETSTDDLLDLFVKETLSFNEKRQILTYLNSIIK